MSCVFFSGASRGPDGSRAEIGAISRALLAELSQRFNGEKTDGEGIAEAALRMVGLDPAEQTVAARSTPIIVRTIREAHACARVLADQAARSAAALAALSYSPAGPGFAEFARSKAGIDPDNLTETQKNHYQYMLQRHVALDAKKYLESGADLQKLVITALRYVSRMSATDIDAAQSTMLAQRNLASTVLDGLASGAGMNPLAAGLDRLHDTCHQGVTDIMLGDAEYGAFMTVDSLALERAAATLTPQQAREAYHKAMANDGGGRALLAALAEEADDRGRRSRSPSVGDRNEEMQVEVAAKRALELHSTAHIVLKVLGERGGIEDVTQQLDAVSRKGAERMQAASGAKAAVAGHLDQAAVKVTADLRARGARYRTAGQQARQFMLSERFEKSLQRMGWLKAGSAPGELLLHEVRASILGRLSQRLHQLEHDGQEPPSDDAGLGSLFERVLSSEAGAVRGMLQRHEQAQKLMEPAVAALRDGADDPELAADACQRSLAALGELGASLSRSSAAPDLDSLLLERQQIERQIDPESSQFRGWWSDLDQRIADLEARERAAEDGTAGKIALVSDKLLAEWASAMPRGEAEQLVDALQRLPRPGVAAGVDASPAARVQAALLKSLGVTEGKGLLIPMEDAALRATLEAEDRLPALEGGRPVRELKGPAGQAAVFFGNDFYQDMPRMHVVLESNGNRTRIGTTPTSNATEDEILAAKRDGIERLVEFVGDEALAARVSRFLSQGMFAPMNDRLVQSASPIQLADGTRGLIHPAPGAATRKAFTLSKTAEGEVSVRVEQDCASAGRMTTPMFIRSLDPARSYIRMGFDFRITREAVRATSPVTYDFRLVEAP